MADRLARVFGTEEDKVNCSFFFKIGACRHGEKCTRLHYKPPQSVTLLIPHMYEQTPIELAMAEGQTVPEESGMQAVRHFEDFYEEVFLEMSKQGEVDELIICDNLGDHIVGNVYVKFTKEEYATNALKALHGRYYAGKLILPEYSPVVDFRESRCRQYEEGQCTRGGYCNFMHLKQISKSFKRSLYRQMYDDHPEYRKRESRSRSHKKSKKDKKKRSRSHKKQKKEKSVEKVEDLPPRQTSEERRAMIAAWNAD